MRRLTILRRRDQRAVGGESRIGRRKTRIPRHRGFDGVRLIDFLIRSDPRRVISDQRLVARR
jgi:hypothetical protein